MRKPHDSSRTPPNWVTLDVNDPVAVANFVQAAQKESQAAAREAIAKLHALGIPVPATDEQGAIVYQKQPPPPPADRSRHRAKPARA